MNRKTLLIVSLMICLMAPLVAWANYSPGMAGNTATTLEQEGNFFPSTLDLFLARGSGNGCDTLINSCRIDCCNAFFECTSFCGQFDLQCRLSCFYENDACEQACLVDQLPEE